MLVNRTGNTGHFILLLSKKQKGDNYPLPVSMWTSCYTRQNLQNKRNY